MSTTIPGAPSLQVSHLFSDPSADVTFKSSDGVLFKIFKTHLETNSAGFCAPDMTVVDEQPISLEEPSNVLETLFQFIHPCLEAKQYRQPSVMDLEPELFFAVAEAAEKYIVYGAMNIFLTRMQCQVVEDRPVEVLNHCDKHGYQDLANTAAYNSLAQPLGSVIDGLTTPGLLARWLRYYNYWRNVVLHVDNIFANGMCPYNNMEKHMAAQVAYSRSVNLDMQFASTIPHKCHRGCFIFSLESEIESMIAEIPEFTDTKE